MEGSADRIWQFKEYSRLFSGVGAHRIFKNIWKKGLVEYDEMESIAWEWQSIDGATTKAPLAQEAVGPNPTDSGGEMEAKDIFLWTGYGRNDGLIKYKF